MKKKVLFFSFMLIIVLIPSVAFAFASDVISDPTPSVDSEISGMVSEIIGLIKYIGYAISTAMLMFIGNKYVMSAASEKANMKQAVLNCVIGAALITSTVTILDMCVDFFAAGKDAPQIIQDGEPTDVPSGFEGLGNVNAFDGLFNGDVYNTDILNGEN